MSSGHFKSAQKLGGWTLIRTETVQGVSEGSTAFELPCCTRWPECFQSTAAGYHQSREHVSAERRPCRRGFPGSQRAIISSPFHVGASGGFKDKQ